MLHGFISLLTSDVWAAILIAVFFGGSIFVHELGHFLAARLTGLYVDRFSIGFGPPIWSWRGKDGVEYIIAWLPLGGYVRLPQLVDMGPIEGSSATDVSKLPPPSYAAKMITLFAGALFNVLFALALATILFATGVPQARDAQTTTIGYVSANVDLPGGKTAVSPAVEAGLKPGDIIRSVDGSKARDWNDITTLVKLSSGRTASGAPEIKLGIERDGRLMTVPVYPKLAGDERYRMIGISNMITPVVHEVTAGSPAAKAGFTPSDVFERIGGEAMLSLPSLNDALDKFAGKTVPVVVRRAGHDLTLLLTPAGGNGNANPAYLATGFAAFTTPTEIVHPSPFSQVWDEVVMTVRTVASLINPHSDVGLSKMTGIIGIVQVYHEVAPEGLIPVMALTILINVNLAILNLLPIPVLDGGHMVFATVGWLRGRSLPLNFIVATQSVFMVMIVVLMVYIGWFDVLRWHRGG